MNRSLCQKRFIESTFKENRHVHTTLSFYIHRSLSIYIGLFPYTYVSFFHTHGSFSMYVGLLPCTYVSFHIHKVFIFHYIHGSLSIYISVSLPVGINRMEVRESRSNSSRSNLSWSRESWSTYATLSDSESKRA